LSPSLFLIEVDFQGRTIITPDGNVVLAIPGGDHRGQGWLAATARLRGVSGHRIVAGVSGSPRESQISIYDAILNSFTTLPLRICSFSAWLRNGAFSTSPMEPAS
jgi:hypothetical protein